MGTNSGCGCAGGAMGAGGAQGAIMAGTAGTAGCSCGGSCGCGATGAAEGALTRPRFFAGQLLTEDDLQQLVTYVVDKQRLHNRALFGDGVACGLEVTCDPCNPGRVTVAPGYAIDCCGNDVVVSCPSSVDILAMIRELRARLRGGQDCGDPCAQDKPAPEPGDGEAERGKGAKDDKVRSTTAPATRDRVYCLYVRFADEAIEAVAPYATDDACAGGSCEPTRIREGFRFELRCRQPGEPPDDVLSHALGCIGDFINAESSFASARAVTMQARRLELAHQIYDLYAAHYEPISRGDVYENDLKPLVAAIDPFIQSTSQREDDPEAAFDAFRALATATARWYLQNGTEHFALSTHSSTLIAQVVVASAKVKAARDAFAQLASKLDTAADQLVAQQMLDQSSIHVPEWNGQTPLPDEPQRSYEALVFAAGAPHSAIVQRTLVDVLADVRRDLLDRIRDAPRTHCDLVREIDALLLPSPSGGAIGRGDGDALIGAANRVTAALLRYFQDCFCAALNPSCGSCTDPAVLLACLRVNDCEITDVCNMGRRWILSAANLRYWLGPLRVVNRLLEAACCEPIPPPRELPHRDPQPEPVPDDIVIGLAAPRAVRAKAMPLRARGLIDVITSPDFTADDLPDLLAGELAAIYLPGGNPRLKFADFARVADQLARMIAARFGDGKSGKTSSGQGDSAIVAMLATPAVKSAVEAIATDAVIRSVTDRRLDLGPAIERSAELTLGRLRAERSQAVRDELHAWAASDDGLARSVRPAIEAAVDRHVPTLEQRQRDELDRVVRNSGLDTSSMTQRIGAAVDAKVAALGLNRESLDSRISSTMQGALAANGLVSDALGRRFDDAIRTRLDTEGLERDALDRRLSLALRSALASEGFTATALGERIQAEVAQSFAREGLTGRTLEERVDGRLRAAIQPLLEAELKRHAAGGAAATAERVEALTRELDSLRAAHASLAKRVADDDGNGGSAPSGRRRKKED
jgi:hypothetical protein